MTPLLTLTDRKDFDILISHQIQTPYLQVGEDGGYGTESVMAFLMQLYAYVLAKFGEEGSDLPCAPDTETGGIEALKAHLMTTGPYHAVVYTTDFRARPQALKLRQRPFGYDGASLGSWIILWPGAKRDNYFRMGRVVYAFHKALQNCRLDRTPAISAMRAILTRGGCGYPQSPLRKSQRPIRLIPP